MSGDTNTTDPAEVTADDEHYGEIDRQREVLTSRLKAAGLALRFAAQALRELTGPLYDVEFVDGHAGEDVAAHIEAARRAVRAAEAITTITTAEARHA